MNFPISLLSAFLYRSIDRECVFTSFYGRLETLNFISILASLSLSLHLIWSDIRHAITIALGYSVSATTAIHNAIYSWCLSKRIIAVYSSRKAMQAAQEEDDEEDERQEKAIEDLEDRQMEPLVSKNFFFFSLSRVSQVFSSLLQVLLPQR